MTTDPTSSTPAQAEPATPEPVQAEPVQAEPVEAAPALDPAIASQVTIPALTKDQDDNGNATESGGEWELLSAKIGDWWQEQNLGEHWQRLRKPLLLAGGLVGLILVLRIYSAVLAAIASVPLAPRLFELVGVSWLAWFSVTRLIRSDERRKVISGLSQRWQAFRGDGGPSTQ
ncbi:Proline-rich region [Synechococcus sp. WH 8101]|uniref:CAAD domain-containing protein n=1 Tax=Synechococcus sp. WH 8101 TaxID=59932 RepID=UPI001022F031|nr:CAAD domain-containing protein [Synechococcus sp. WH 8101]QBE68474.1 Proline-rich region [Synechococcus sp. WH 8101]QNI44687.1 hypothetical protein SynRCC2555_00899 [Synechococcus sp. WH 8101]